MRLVLIGSCPTACRHRQAPLTTLLADARICICCCCCCCYYWQAMLLLLQFWVLLRYLHRRSVVHNALDVCSTGSSRRSSSSLCVSCLPACYMYLLVLVLRYRHQMKPTQLYRKSTLTAKTRVPLPIPLCLLFAPFILTEQRSAPLCCWCCCWCCCLVML